MIQTEQEYDEALGLWKQRLLLAPGTYLDTGDEHSWTDITPYLKELVPWFGHLLTEESGSTHRQIREAGEQLLAIALGDADALDFMPELYQLARAFGLDDQLLEWCATNYGEADAKSTASRVTAYWSTAEAYVFDECGTLLHDRRNELAKVICRDGITAHQRLVNRYVRERAELVHETANILLASRRDATQVPGYHGRQVIRRARQLQIEGLLARIPLP